MATRHIRTTYRTLLRHLVHLPDIEIQRYYRDRYRTVCRKASKARHDDGQRETRYLGQLRKETRRLEAIRSVVCEHTAAPGREQRTERKYALRAYSRMVDQTYARAGKRRWQLLDAIYPPPLRLPTLRSPPPIPAHLVPLIQTVNLTAQQHRDRSLREKYATPAYVAWIARKREWKRHTKFLRGAVVPLVVPPDVGAGEKEKWTVPAERLIHSAQTIASGLPTPAGTLRTLLTTHPFPSATRRIPRPIRRIYQRLLGDLPSLLPPGASGAWKLARGEGWVPPEASVEDKRWIGGAG